LHSPARSGQAGLQKVGSCLASIQRKQKHDGRLHRPAAPFWLRRLRSRAERENESCLLPAPIRCPRGLTLPPSEQSSTSRPLWPRLKKRRRQDLYRRCWLFSFRPARISKPAAMSRKEDRRCSRAIIKLPSRIFTMPRRQPPITSTARSYEKES